MDPALISLVVAFSLAGSVMGLLTGLIPGIHVNTLASLLLVGYPAIAGALQELIPGSWIPVGVCCLIMSASVVHSFVDFVPSVFIGAPDADTALSVLPGHRLLLRGEGMKAVRAAAVGSLVGCTSALLLALPLQYIMSYGVSDAMDRITKIVLLIVSGVLLMNEYRKGNLLYGTAAFVLSGALGYAVMKMPIPASGILGEGTLLMPMLTGLFGLPTMIMASKGHPFPAQKECRGDPVGPIPGLKGVIMGTVAGWFPGITSTVGATVSATIMPDRSPERFISTVASIGTVTSVLSLVTLSVSGGGRSGTVIVIGQILGDSIRGTATEPFILLLLAAAVGSLLGYFLTIRSAEVMCGLVSRVPQNLMNRAVIAFLVLMVVATTGLWGIVILASALAIGLIPVSAENGKTVLCGCLILPVLLM